MGANVNNIKCTTTLPLLTSPSKQALAYIWVGKLLQVPFLGHIISNGGVVVYHRKLQDILNRKSPHNGKDIRSFLGIAEYYWRFIEGFSKIVKFEWTTEWHKAFEELKKQLTTTPMMVLPDIQKLFSVYCDASHLVPRLYPYARRKGNHLLI